MLVGCAHGALIAVACVLFATDAGAADRTIVIGGAAARHPGTIVIGGSGTSRAYDQVAGLPSGGSVQVDLGAIDGTSRIRLRPPGSTSGYAPPAARNNLALRPPSASVSAGRGPMQLAQTPPASSGRIVLRPPLPTPRPAQDMAYRAPAGGTDADTAALNRTQLAEVAADAPLRVSIPARRPDLQPPPQRLSPPQRLPAPMSDERGPARPQFAAAPRTPESSGSDIRETGVRGQDARALNLAVLATVEASPAPARPPAPMPVSVAPAPAPIRTETNTARLADDLRPRTVAADPAPMRPAEPEPEAPPPVATIGVGVPTRQPPAPVTPHQQTAALPPDPTIAARPTIYWTSPRVDAPPPPAALPAVEAPAVEAPAVEAAAAEERLAAAPAPEPASLPPAPIPAAPLPADEPSVGLLPSDRHRLPAPAAAAPTDTPIITWEPPAALAEAATATAALAPLPDAPPGIVSVADRYAGRADKRHADRAAGRSEVRGNDSARSTFGDRSLRDRGFGPAGREDHPSMPGVPSADVERTPGGGLIESLMGREAGAPVAAGARLPLPTRAPLRESTFLPPEADARADDRAPEPDRIAAPALPAPQPPAGPQRRALTADEEASLAAASSERSRGRPAPYLSPVAAVPVDSVSAGPRIAPPEATEPMPREAAPSASVPSGPAPVKPSNITWTSPPRPAAPAARSATPEAEAEAAVPAPFTPAEVSAMGAASGAARTSAAATEMLAPEPDRDRPVATPQPVLPDRPQMAALPAPARYPALPAPPPMLALPAPAAEAPARESPATETPATETSSTRSASVRTPSVAALPEPPAADLGLFARAGEPAPPPRRDEIASLPPAPREPAAPLPAPIAEAPVMAAPTPAAPTPAAPVMAAPVAAAPTAPAPVAAAPTPAAPPAAATAPRDYPLLPPPRRPVSADGRVSSVEPAPGQGHLELPPDFLPGLRADRGVPPSRAVASADAGVAAPPGAETAPAADGPAAASIVFGAGGADLPRTADGDVEEVARRLLQDPALRVQVRAYADGADDANKRQLSLYRALSVRSALIEEGVRSTRIAVQALGGKTQMNPRDRVDLVVMRS